jgi:hypothetical protein
VVSSEIRIASESFNVHMQYIMYRFFFYKRKNKSDTVGQIHEAFDHYVNANGHTTFTLMR